MKQLLGCALALSGLAAVLTAAEPFRPQVRNVGGVRNLTLEEAVKLALIQNPDILEAKLEIERTRGLVIEVRAQALPQLASTTSYNQQDPYLLDSGSGAQRSVAFRTEANQGTGSSSSQQTQSSQQSSQSSQGGSAGIQDKYWQISVQVTQVIYAGGQVRSAIKIANFEEDSSYFSLIETINTVVATVRKQFYQVLLNRALIKVQEESVQLLQSELDNQQSRFDAGTVPRFNVLRAEVALSNNRPNLIRAKNDYLISQLQLAKTLGIPYSSGEGGAKSPLNAEGQLTVTRRSINLRDALVAARAQRAFLKVQRLLILIDAEQIRLALSGYKPRFDLNGGYELQNARFSNDLAETVNGWFFGIQGSWNIFDGLETYGKVKQAKAKLESSKVNYDNSVLQVELEVQDAYARFLEAIELLASQTKNVEQALEALRLANERLAAGAGTQLDVLDARFSLTQARTTELQARYDYNTALADFEKATGDATSYGVAFNDPVMRAFRKKKAQ